MAVLDRLSIAVLSFIEVQPNSMNYLSIYLDARFEPAHNRSTGIGQTALSLDSLAESNFPGFLAQRFQCINKQLLYIVYVCLSSYFATR